MLFTVETALAVYVGYNDGDVSILEGSINEVCLNRPLDSYDCTGCQATEREEAKKVCRAT